MTTPGYTAYVCMDHRLGTSRSAAAVEATEPTNEVVPQLCSTLALGICSPFLQACFYGGCWWARAIGGPGACTTCMAGCLAVSNPVMFPICVECVGSKPCTSFKSLGCPTNVCA
jgi:hypothetical protein